MNYNQPIITSLSNKYQTVVPSKLRNLMKIDKGDQLVWSVDTEGDEPIMKVALKKRKLGDYLLGLGRGVWNKLDTSQYVDNLRNEWNK